MKIASWNVYGLARCRRNGFLKFLADAKPNVLCCREIKGQYPPKAPEYLQFWNPAKRNNYSGTLVLAKRQSLSCRYGLGHEKFDEEGQLITLEYKDYFIVNVYVPNLNPHSPPDRLDFRMEWDKAVREYVTKRPKPAILCSDFNVTREYIDIYPENQKNALEEPLFQSEERAGFEALLSAFTQKGRSAHDAYAYILRELSQEDPPLWIVKADVAAFFDNAMHSWLIGNIPMDKTVLRKFRRAALTIPTAA